MKYLVFSALLAVGVALGCSSTPPPPERSLPANPDRVPRGLEVLIRPVEKQTGPKKGEEELTVRFWVHYTDWTEPLSPVVIPPDTWRSIATGVSFNKESWWASYHTWGNNVDSPIILRQHTPFMMASDGVHLGFRVAPLANGKYRLDLRARWKIPRAYLTPDGPLIKSAERDGIEIPGNTPTTISMSASLHDDSDLDRY